MLITELKNKETILAQAEGSVFAILCHGYTMQARGIAGPASKFYEMGYSLLLPDARAHGKSGGRFIGMGWAERWDLIGWVEYLNQRYGAPRVVLYGRFPT